LSNHAESARLQIASEPDGEVGGFLMGYEMKMRSISCTVAGGPSASPARDVQASATNACDDAPLIRERTAMSGCIAMEGSGRKAGLQVPYLHRVVPRQEMKIRWHPASGIE
jgi:hypothetical protein